MFAGTAEEVTVLAAACSVALSKRDVGWALQRLRGIKPAAPAFRAARAAIAEISLTHRTDEPLLQHTWTWSALVAMMLRMCSAATPSCGCRCAVSDNAISQGQRSRICPISFGSWPSQSSCLCSRSRFSSWRVHLCSHACCCLCSHAAEGIAAYALLGLVFLIDNVDANPLL